jgi:16S rRNA (guanine966-N2)-methyltransferase
MTDRVKEAVFSSLGDRVRGAVVLDLYAGSGSLGLEALSRGAESATFVEKHRMAAGVIRQNLDLVGLGGEVVVADVEDHLSRPGPAVDLAFVDPPYDLPLPSVARVLGSLVPRLAEGATVVVHRRHGSGEVEAPDGLTVADRRRYGDAEITRLTKGPQQEEAPT